MYNTGYQLSHGFGCREKRVNNEARGYEIKNKKINGTQEIVGGIQDIVGGGGTMGGILWDV